MYPRSANAESTSEDIPLVPDDLTEGKRERSIRPESIPVKSRVLRLDAHPPVRIVPVTSRRHHARARLSPASPCHIHISIRSYACPRSHASTIAPPLSETVPTPSPSKKICVPKSYDFGAAIIPVYTGAPLAPCVPFPLSLFSAS